MTVGLKQLSSSYRATFPDGPTIVFESLSSLQNTVQTFVNDVLSVELTNRLRISSFTLGRASFPSCVLEASINGELEASSR